MGYYTALTFEVVIKPGVDIAEFRKKLDERKAGQDFIWEDLDVTNEGDVKLSEYYVKAYSDDVDELAKFLAPYVKKGCKIHGDGEETEDNWCITFDGEGDYENNYGNIVYCTPYEHFMKNHGHELPPQLKLELEKWWCSIHI